MKNKVAVPLGYLVDLYLDTMDINNNRYSEEEALKRNNAMDLYTLDIPLNQYVELLALCSLGKPIGEVIIKERTNERVN